MYVFLPRKIFYLSGAEGRIFFFLKSIFIKTLKQSTPFQNRDNAAEPFYSIQDTIAMTPAIATIGVI